MTGTCPPPSRSARPRTGPVEPVTCSPCGLPPSGRPCTRTSTSRSRPGSPRPKPGGTTASTPAAYREAAGITNPGQAVASKPHRNQPELEAMRKAVFAALEIRDEADFIRGLDCGELEALALQGQRARAAAPPDVSRQLRLTAQAEADAHRQAADARTQHDHTAAASAT